MTSPGYLALLFCALLFGFQIAYAESVMNKCTDGTDITYTDKPCEKLGLKSAGPIKYTVTIIPSLPASPAPQIRSRTKEGRGSGEAVSSAVESDVYQCTAYFGIVSFSSSPCPEFSYVPQLGFNRPVQQQIISRKAACEKMSANPESVSGSSVSCP